MRTIMPAWNLRPTTQTFYSDFDPLFEKLFDNQSVRKPELACDFYENDKLLLFSFDLPGLEENEIKIEVKNLILSISGNRKEEFLDDSLKSYKTRRHGEFKHQYSLPKNIDKEKIEANYNNGVLKILLPKVAEEAPKNIEVKSSKGNLLDQILKKDSSGKTYSES
jgi:HSP20 family protein